MDCGRCGLWIESPHQNGMFYDTEAIVCPECGTTNVISVDAEQEEVWVQGWKCKHGQDEETPCAACDLEDEEKKS